MKLENNNKSFSKINKALFFSLLSVVLGFSPLLLLNVNIDTFNLVTPILSFFAIVFGWFGFKEGFVKKERIYEFLSFIGIMSGIIPLAYFCLQFLFVLGGMGR